MEAEEAALAYLAFPATHRTKIRTNNVQERRPREIKRRTRVVQGSPRAKSLIRLVERRSSSRRVVGALRHLRPRSRTPGRPGARAGEAEVLAAREAARQIIGSAIDPKEDEG